MSGLHPVPIDDATLHTIWKFCHSSSERTLDELLADIAMNHEREPYQTKDLVIALINEIRSLQIQRRLSRK